MRSPGWIVGVIDRLLTKLKKTLKSLKNIYQFHSNNAQSVRYKFLYHPLKTLQTTLTPGWIVGVMDRLLTKLKKTLKSLNNIFQSHSNNAQNIRYKFLYHPRKTLQTTLTPG
jgi:hypothetical protein